MEDMLSIVVCESLSFIGLLFQDFIPSCVGDVWGRF